MDDSEFNSEAFQLSPEQAEALARDYQEAREDAVAGFHSLLCPQALVWHRLHYLAWKTGSATVTLANKTLAEMGVSRSIKSRALQLLERDGLIKVKRRGRHSPTVTIINWRPIRSRSGK
jgi:ABC-type metal ion transport system substrate-binding protein